MRVPILLLAALSLVGCDHLKSAFEQHAEDVQDAAKEPRGGRLLPVEDANTQAPPVDFSKLRLAGIMWSAESGESAAMVEVPGKDPLLLREGSVLEGEVKVHKIHQDRIVVAWPGPPEGETEVTLLHTLRLQTAP